MTNDIGCIHCDDIMCWWTCSICGIGPLCDECRERHCCYEVVEIRGV